MSEPLRRRCLRHEAIFDVFHEEATGGVPGVGLFITRQIVERHGGTVPVRSLPGEGATFVPRSPLLSHEAQA